MQVTECEQTQLYFTMLIIWNYWQLTAAVCLKLTCLSQYECSWLSLWTVITNDKLTAALADPGMGQPGGLPQWPKVGTGHGCVKQSASDTGRVYHLNHNFLPLLYENGQKVFN